MTEEQAILEIKSRRPSNVEYYIRKGMTPDQAEAARREFNSRCGKIAASAPKVKLRQRSPRCIEYWIRKGYNEEAARDAVRDHQSTFALSKCIKKHGRVEGERIWRERQARWLETMSSIDQEFHSRKNALSVERIRRQTGSEDEAWGVYSAACTKRGMTVFRELDEFVSHVADYASRHPEFCYQPIEKMASRFSASQFEWLRVAPSEVLDQFQSKDGGVFLSTRGRRVHYKKWVGKSLLRSAYEIKFHDMLSSAGIECDIDGRYPDSNLRYDFFLPEHGIYVEVAPNYDLDEAYRKKMDRKAMIFGCVVLKNTADFEAFVESLCR